jgi:hypothetical protein
VSALFRIDGLLPIQDRWSGGSVAGLADPHQATLVAGA